MRATRVRRGAALAIGAAGLVLALAPALPAAAGTAAPAGSAPAAPALVSGGGKVVSAPALSSALKATAGTGGSLGKAGTAAPKLKAGAAPGSVIGTDSRVQEYSTTTNPWGSIVHIESTVGGCTGFLLNRDTVVTAGHCVYWNGAWATNYTVSPGRYGVNNKPYGSCTGTSADVWSNSTWTSSYNSDYDYGLIKLRCDVGNSTGWMGWWYSSGENLTGQSFYVEGYPGDKAYGTMWWGNGTVSSYNANRMFHTIDTYSGESGSPVYRYRSASEGLCAGWCVTGIHTTGGSTNGATRFNSSSMSVIQYVMNLP